MYRPVRPRSGIDLPEQRDSPVARAQARVPVPPGVRRCCVRFWVGWSCLGHSVFALGADQVEDDLLGSVGGDFVFDVEGAVAVEDEVAGVSHDGGASRGDAVLGEKEQEAREELVHLGGRVELGEIAEEFGGEGGVGLVGGCPEVVKRAQARAGVAGLLAAVASCGGAMAAARKSGVDWLDGWLSALRLRIHFGTTFPFIVLAFVDFAECCGGYPG